MTVPYKSHDENTVSLRSLWRPENDKFMMMDTSGSMTTIGKTLVTLASQQPNDHFEA